MSSIQGEKGGKKKQKRRAIMLRHSITVELALVLTVAHKFYPIFKVELF